MSYLPRFVDLATQVGPGRPTPTLAFVIPCFNEEAALPILLRRLSILSEELAATGRSQGLARIVLIDDGSQDGTWRLIQDATRAHNVTGIRLSRNHGHQRALLAGLMQADADVVISMDADLQDDPGAVPDMLDAYARGSEIVFGVREARDADTPFKRTSARAYYGLLSWLGVDLVPDHADFRLMSRKALATLAGFEETNLFLRGMIPQLGFATETVVYDRGARSAGESKYPLGKMLALAIEGITSFSIKPLRLIALLGALVAGLAFALLFYSLAAWMAGRTIDGWTSTVLPIYLLGGTHLVALGVVGEYIGKIYQEVKRRPRFIIDETVTAAPAGVAFHKQLVGSDA